MAQATPPTALDDEHPVRFLRTIRLAIRVVPPATIGFFAGLMVWMLTRKGIGLLADSALYFQAADGLAEGRGFAEFSAKIPPLYPFTLTAFTSVLGDQLTAARWISILAFAATGVLVTLLVAHTTRSRIAGLLAGALTITSVRVLATIPWALTEPLFYALTVAGLWLLFRYGRQPTWGRLVLAAAVVGLAVLTRYAGVALILTGLVVVFDRSAGVMRDRIERSVVFAGVSGAGVAAYVVRNAFAGESAVGREFIVQETQYGEALKVGLRSLGSWLLGPSFSIGLQQVVVLLLLLAGLYLWRTARADGAATTSGGRSLPWLIVVFAASYLATWWVTVAFIGNVALDHRFLAPLYIALLTLAVAVAAASVRSRGVASVGKVTAIAVVVLILVSSIAETSRGFTWQGGGLGYSTDQWRRSPTARAVKQLPSIPIASNAPDAVYFLAGRDADWLPWRSIAPGTANRSFETERDELIEKFERGKVVIVYFFLVSRPYVPEAGEILAVLPGAEMERLLDGAIIRPRRIDA